MLYVDPHTDPAAWQQHGALLAALDRLRVEIHAAIRTPATTWHPAPLMGRSGDTARHSRTPARDQHDPRQGSRLRERLRRTASTPAADR